MQPIEKDRTLRRKRSAAKEPTHKRARSESSDDESPEGQILLLENAILESKRNYNSIATLQQITHKYQDGDEAAIVAAVSLCRVFVRLLAAGSLTNRKGLSEKDAVVVQWLKDRLGEYKKTLLGILGQDEWAGTALTLCLRLLKAEGEYLSDKEDYSFPKASLASIVNVLLYSDISDGIRNEYVEKYVAEHNDIRLYTFKAIKAILTEGCDVPAKAALFSNAMAILAATNTVPKEKEKPKSFYLAPPQKKNHAVRSVPQLKKSAQEAWLALMRLAATKDQRKQLLSIMASDIAPWFTQPELLSDFLTDCYNAGGSISLLALSGVFYLIQERNLDYPSFYTKLYSLLDGNILHSKHRSRFFRLLDTFLASTHLPAALVASFIKRLSRLSLFAPPGAIVVVVPFIYNLFKEHPQTTFMMHRTLDHLPELKAEVEREGFEDPFDPDETDPMETHAIDSCIWEIVQLQSHYHPNVATIAKIVSEQFTKQQYNMEDFLDHSYHSLLDAEFGKVVKKPPVVEFMIPKHIFMPHGEDSPAEAEDSLLVKLIDFS